MAKKRIKKDSCPNCAQTLKEVDEFCPQCGQENHTINRPFKYLFWEILESAFNLDSKTWKSLSTLFRHPGKIALEFNAGKRKSYVPPVRFFLLSSIIFFLLLSFNRFGDNNIPKIDTNVLFANDDTIPLNLGVEHFNITKTEYNALLNYNAAQVDSFLVTKSVSPSFFNRKMVMGFPKVMRDLQFFEQKMYKNFSFAVFFMVPLFAFILVFLYNRQKKFYIEHLIFGLNYHSFFFLMSSILVIIGWFVSSELSSLLSFCFSFIYLILALKGFYQQGWGKTILKACLLYLSYTIVVAIVMVIASLAAIIFL